MTTIPFCRGRRRPTIHDYEFPKKVVGGPPPAFAKASADKPRAMTDEGRATAKVTELFV